MGVSVGYQQFLKLLSNAWQSSMKPRNIKSGFSATGIHPLNPERIPNEAYTSSDILAGKELRQRFFKPFCSSNVPLMTMKCPRSVFDLPQPVDVNLQSILPAHGGIEVYQVGIV